MMLGYIIIVAWINCCNYMYQLICKYGITICIGQRYTAPPLFGGFMFKRKHMVSWNKSPTAVAYLFCANHLDLDFQGQIQDCLGLGVKEANLEHKSFFISIMEYTRITEIMKKVLINVVMQYLLVIAVIMIWMETIACCSFSLFTVLTLRHCYHYIGNLCQDQIIYIAFCE